MLGPANASPAPETSHAYMRRLGYDLRLWCYPAGKKQSPSQAAIEISPEAISYNARFRPATNCTSITAHAIIATAAAQQQALRNQTPPASPPRVAKWIAGTLSAVDRQTLFARLGPQRSTADCSAVVSPQNATARARYLPEMQAAALRVHPMWHVKSKQGLCVYLVRHQIRLSSQSASHRKPNQAAHPICSEKLHA